MHAVAAWAVALLLLQPLTPAVGQQQHELSAAGTHAPTRRTPFILTESTPAPQRCISTLGDWCLNFHNQKAIPWRPAPRGNKTCPGDCNTIGNCNHDSGLCECPAGWIGADCKTVQKRPCTDSVRLPDDRSEVPKSHIDEDGRDLNWLEGGGTHSRCGGICDDTIAMCWCDGPQGRINAPKGSPPGTPPVKRGRPMPTTQLQPKEDKHGNKVGWGDQTYAALYGPTGWCVADRPTTHLPCIADGLDGEYCDEVVEPFCVNQCGGHGECNLGFCKCDPGWYGHDCSRRAVNLPLEPGRIPTTPWLSSTVMEPPAAQEPPPAPERKRPLIYVYDLEPLYSQRLLQYRIPSSWCVHRRYQLGNVTLFTDLWVYAVDTLFHELLLQSEHRTFDPEEADFFYVPQYSTCYIYPIHGWADYPWFPVPGLGLRVPHAAQIVLETKQWVQKHFPYWDRKGGKDHIWLFTHDEGACWVPTEVAPSIWITHWGRMGLNHSSNTAFPGDNYNEEHISWRWPEGWKKMYKGHACYDPQKDLVIPSFKSPNHYHKSPLMGNAPQARDILLFFKGDVGKHRRPNYSRGVRQRLYKLSVDNKWREKHNVQIGDSRDVQGDYSQLLSRSKFCLVAPGDGWSARAEDSIIHGCVPVVIMDGVHQVFESILDWSTFGVRIPEADIDRTLDILLAIPEQKLKSLQAHLARVWYRFRYLKGPALSAAAAPKLAANLEATQQLREMHGGGPSPHRPRPFRGDPTVDDAFTTIVQWLHSKIDDDKGLIT